MDGKTGEKVKLLRSAKKMTLKELSRGANLSISYISQVERGISSINISSLEKIARSLDVPMEYFLDPPASHESCIMRNYEQSVFTVKDSLFFYNRLSNDTMKNAAFEPIIVNVLPHGGGEKVETYSHEGEEFIYVLEGILTLFIGNEQFQLNPGDSAHYDSLLLHEWANFTAKMVRILAVSTPARLKGLKVNGRKTAGG